MYQIYYNLCTFMRIIRLPNVITLFQKLKIKSRKRLHAAKNYQPDLYWWLDTSHFGDFSFFSYVETVAEFAQIFITFLLFSQWNYLENYVLNELKRKSAETNAKKKKKKGKDKNRSEMGNSSVRKVRRKCNCNVRMNSTVL